MENTFAMIKPDGIKKGLVVEILNRFSSKKIRVLIFNFVKLDKKIVREHYSDIVGEYYYANLEKYMLSGYVAPMILSGRNSIEEVRKIIGDTDPRKAEPQTIRGQFGNKIRIEENIIHASDSREKYIEETKRFFGEETFLKAEKEIVFAKK